MKLHQIKSKNRKYIDVMVILVVNILISMYFIVNRVVQVYDTVPGVVINLVSETESKKDTAQKGQTEKKYDSSSWQGVQIIDGQQVWSTNTKVDVFKLECKEEGSVVSVDGGDDYVAASGVSNIYNFTVSNKSDAPIDYQLAVEAYFSNKNYTIPVAVRFLDKDGRYYAGSEERWVSVTELGKVSDYEVLKAGSDNGYTLEWKLPDGEEGQYDTLSESMEEDTNITLTVVIHTKAMIDKDLYAAQNDDNQGNADSRGSKESHKLRIFGFNVQAEDAVKPLLWCVLAVVVLIMGFRVFTKGKVK